MSDDDAPYTEVFQLLHGNLSAVGHEVIPLYADRLKSTDINEADLVVTIGVRAAEKVAAVSSRAPVLAVLVPRSWYIRSGRARLMEGGRRTVSAIYLDQPFERQVRLIRLAFPEARRVGVLVSGEQSGLLDALQDALRAQHLSMVPGVVVEGERLTTALEQVFGEADLLLALPDPMVFNQHTAQSLFLTSYRYRDPVMGYSRSLSRAGALISLYSTPAQIGRQAAEWVSSAFKVSTLSLPSPAYPTYYEIAINDQVARSLGFSLPSENTLTMRLEGGR